MIWTPGKSLHELKLQIIREALEYFVGNMPQTAAALDISIRGLRDICKKQGWHIVHNHAVGINNPHQEKLQ